MVASMDLSYRLVISLHLDWLFKRIIPHYYFGLSKQRCCDFDSETKGPEFATGCKKLVYIYLKNFWRKKINNTKTMIDGIKTSLLVF